MLRLLEEEFISNANRLFFSLMTPLLILIILLFKMLFFSSTSKTKTKTLPPSPRKLPIIGNFHQMGAIPARALWSLAQRYGPVMLLHFGQVPVLVASSPEAAREVMKTNDLSFASKPELRNFKHLLYGMKDVFGLPYGEEWRRLRSLFVLHLLSKKRVQSFRTIREEETALLIKKITDSSSSSSSTLEMKDLFATLSNDVGCRTAFGRKYKGEGQNVKKIKHLLCEFNVLVAAFTFRDYIPVLGWMDYLSGMDARVKNTAKGIDEFLEGLIEERMGLLEEKRARGINLDDDKQDFFDALLSMQIENNSTGISLTRDSIKALLLDAYIGGTDTTSVSLEWAMAELLNHPDSMKKLQKEVREVLNGKLEVGEDDLEKMVFLKAVIRETFRMHPPATMTSRKAMRDTKLMGYDVAAGTMILINVWGIGNDPELWDRPHDFRPERFLDSSIDFLGHHFEYTPFGAGRRQCPGISFGISLIEYVLANIVHKFDWDIPRTGKGEELDMSERHGSGIVGKRIPLQALATPFNVMNSGEFK